RFASNECPLLRTQGRATAERAPRPHRAAPLRTREWMWNAAHDACRYPAVADDAAPVHGHEEDASPGREVARPVPDEVPEAIVDERAAHVPGAFYSMGVAADDDVRTGPNELSRKRALDRGRALRELDAPVQEDDEGVGRTARGSNLLQEPRNVLRRGEAGLVWPGRPRGDQLVVQDL